MFRALQRRLSTGLDMQVACDMPSDIDDFLYLPTYVCGTLAEIAMRLQLLSPNNHKLTVRIAHEGASITFGVPHKCDQAATGQWRWMRDHVDFAARNLGNTPVKLTVREEEVILETPFEPVLQSHRGLRYSVVF